MKSCVCLMIVASLPVSSADMAEKMNLDLDPCQIAQISRMANSWLNSVSMDVRVKKDIPGEGRWAEHFYRYCQEGDPLRGGRLAWEGEIKNYSADGSVWNPGCSVTRALLGHKAYPNHLMVAAGPLPQSGPLNYLRIETNVLRTLMYFREDPKSGFFLDGWVYGNRGKTVAQILSDGEVTCQGTERLLCGEECLVLQKATSKDSITVWASLGQGCLPLKWLVENAEIDPTAMPNVGIWLSPGQRWYAETIITRVANIQGKFLPVEGHFEYGVVENGGRTVVGQVFAERQNITLHPDWENDDAFSIKIPNGTLVRLTDSLNIHGGCFQWHNDRVIKVAGPYARYRIAAMKQFAKESFTRAGELLADKLPRPTGFTFALSILGVAALLFGSGVLVGFHIRRLGNASDR